MACLNNCWLVFLRIFIFIVNAITTIIGGVLFILSLILIVATVTCQSDCSVSPGFVGLFVLLISAVMLMVGICGCIGACISYSSCAIITYLWTKTISFIVFFLVLIVVLVLYIKNPKSFKATKLKNSYSNYGNSTLTTFGIDLMQGMFHCCGYSGKSDFSDSSVTPVWTSKYNSTYPCSCCTYYSCRKNSTSSSSKRSMSLVNFRMSRSNSSDSSSNSSSSSNSTAYYTVHSMGCKSKLALNVWGLAGIVLYLLLSLLALVFAYIVINNIPYHPVEMAGEMAKL